MIKKYKNKSGFLTVDCIAAKNRKARHEYQIADEFEAGIILVGTEVKSLRTGQANLTDAYADVNKNGDIYLLNAYIPEYQKAMKGEAHGTRRERKLLLHAREITKLIGKIKTKGYTLIPLDIHFNSKGIAKVKIGLAKGKSKYDKRQSEKDKSWQREKKEIY